MISGEMITIEGIWSHFWGKVIIFGAKFITFMGPLSLKLGLCRLCQIHQKILAWVQPPTPPFLAMPGFRKRLTLQPLPNLA